MCLLRHVTDCGQTCDNGPFNQCPLLLWVRDAFPPFLHMMEGLLLTPSPSGATWECGPTRPSWA